MRRGPLLLIPALLIAAISASPQPFTKVVIRPVQAAAIQQTAFPRLEQKVSLPV